MIARAVLATLHDTTSRSNRAGEVFVGGASRIASAFDAVETVQRCCTCSSSSSSSSPCSATSSTAGLQVAIGSETGMETLADAALVVAPYTVDGERAGSIGVLGPARMNYREAMAAVAAVSNRLETHLTES